MLRQTFEREMQQLQDELLVLGSMVENAIAESVVMLKKRDVEGSRRLAADDRFINERRYKIEADTLTIIATQQPIASDLRVLASTLEIAAELERIGDYAKGIARITLLMGNQPPVKPLIDIPRMVEIAVHMLHRAVTAFINHDAEAARQIPPEDDKVDALYNQIYRELVTIMLNDPSTIDRANYLLWVAHNLERVADRVTNICERAIYTATGQLMEFAPSDDEIVAPL
jgi:phosphate transport system protein